jgi:hypothetical protein
MNISTEAWWLVLNHFDSESLKKCLEWSDTFRDLIITTPTLMRKLPVVLQEHSWRERLSFVEAHGGFVKAVKCQNLKIDDVKRFLELTPNVEEIICENSIEEDDESEDETNVDENNETNVFESLTTHDSIGDLNLQELRKLEIKGFSTYSLNLFKLLRHCTTLQVIKLTNRSDRYVSKSLGHFLLNQSHLEHLELISRGNYSPNRMVDAIFTENFLQKCSFRLKRLNLSCNLEYREELGRFLVLQSKSIEVLILFNFCIDFHYIRIVLNNFSQLKKLHISVSGFLNSSRAEEIKDIRVLSLRELHLVGFCDDVGVCMTLTGIFPEIEVLSLTVQNFSLRGILEKLPKLRKITAWSARIEMFAFSKRESLKELILFDVHPITDPLFTEQLARALPNLERMSIRNYGHSWLHRTIDNDVKLRLESLQYFQHLKHFRFSNKSQTISVENDEDQVEISVESPRNFYITIGTVGGEKRIEASEYFRQNHLELIRTVERRFGDQ